MTLAVYAEGELNCDGPGKPYSECVQMPPVAEIHHTARTTTLCRNALKAIAKRAGWLQVKGKWMCPGCHKISKW